MNSRASLAPQEQSENQLREKATAVLGAASRRVAGSALEASTGRVLSLRRSLR